MGFQLKHTLCSKIFATGPSELGNVVCQMENQTKSRKNQGDYIFSRSILARKTEPNLKLYGETLKVYPQVKFLGITFDSQLTFKKHFEDILDSCNTRYHRLRLLANKGLGRLAHPPKSKFKNNASDQFLNSALFRPLPPRTISSAKFNGSRTSLFGLPFVYQNTFVLSYFMTLLAFHM